MSEHNSIGMAYLSHGELGNHNAGEGGSQLSNLKMYDGKAYISGQALRHAVRDALRSHTSEGVDCTPTQACGDVENCKMCDLFGYMNTELDPEDDGRSPTRTAPLRMTPALGVYSKPVVTDMVVQYGVEGSVKGAESDNSIGYREIVENVYKGAWMVDSQMVGRVEAEEMFEDEDPGNKYSRELENFLSGDDREQRLNELIDSLRDHCSLAGQARHMADFMPDLCVAVSTPSYNQRVTNSLQVDEDTEELQVKTLESVCKDIVSMGGEVYIAGTYNDNVISNWEEVMETAEEIEGVEVVDSVVECYEKLKYD